MRPMTRLVLGTAFLAGIFAAVALGLPSHVTVSRSVVINAPESVIFPYLNNLHKFEDWSPWRVRDPQLAVSYGGPESGQGARVTWSSKKPSVGTGSMEISEVPAQPPHRPCREFQRLGRHKFLRRRALGFGKQGHMDIRLRNPPRTR